VSSSSEFRYDLLFFGFELFAAGLFLALSLEFSLLWFGQLGYAAAAGFYGLLAFWQYENLVEMYEEQAGSDASSSGREVIQVEVENCP
jgi:hypothetical protein